ncbi:glycoside hydrolase family 9 protein [Paenibacillus sp. 1P07SE]|uniref:glycoside hydrolase family 9 protein n=1 Tax=Paenibacillus sp. 1P07SE TaxID=3132209 RepID=UPI0039A56553
MLNVLHTRYRKLMVSWVALVLVLSSVWIPGGSPQRAADAASTTSDAAVQVAVSQAGYSKEDMKLGSVASARLLPDLAFTIAPDGGNAIFNGTLQYEGLVWGEHVYTADFTSLQQSGTALRLYAGGEQSPLFRIEDNIWLRYRDEMTAFYRSLRASVDTIDALPAGYTDTPLSPKAYHQAGHLDDAWDKNDVFATYDITLLDGTRPAPGLHYDLTGGHYDAGDYGKYAGNQWVGGQLALAYLRFAESDTVQFDYDNNGVPDILDEVRVATEYVLKFTDQFDGAVFDIPEKGGFRHPELLTDNHPLSPVGYPDDRTVGRLGIGGSFKAAGVMASAARAYEAWLDEYGINDADAEAFAARAAAGAVKTYEYAYINREKSQGSYHTNLDITNAMLWAEVELYLLTGDPPYYDRAVQRVALLEEGDVSSTNYWSMRPMAMVELYPVADAVTQARIQELLKSRVDYFMSVAQDTPYGVLNEFSNFGVNEPHVSYVGDLVRYYELFGDPEVLSAAKKGLYWVFGNNPWSTSWVSGVGEHHVRYLHTRYDTEIRNPNNEGIVIPGAMVSGPNVKDPTMPNSVSGPWYQDRTILEDDVHQWRYNEFSISIQAGLFYSIMALGALDEPSVPAGNEGGLTILSPQIGDLVTGEVQVVAAASPGVSSVQLGNTAMIQTGEVWTGAVNTSASRPYANGRLKAKGTDVNGSMVSANAHYTVAPPLPSPEAPLLFDNFEGGGIWGSQNLAWMNWWTQGAQPANTTDGTYVRGTEDGVSVGIFTHEPSSPQAQAKFQPWHYKADLSGYQYLYVTLKNSGRHPGLQFKAQINARDVNGGLQTVPNEWTTLQFDLDQMANLNKSAIELTLWLRGGTQAGDMLIDNIYAGNETSGSAPVLSDADVHALTGDEDTTFHYSVVYTDADNDLPHDVQLIVNGVVQSMVEADVTDHDVTNGKRYILSKNHVRGPHQFYVRTTDTRTAVVQTAVQTGPAVTSVSSPSGMPGAPVNLQVVSVTDATVLLEWTPPLDDRALTGYHVYQDGVLVGMTGAGAVSYEVNSLQQQTSYVFHLTALGAGGQESALSHTISVTTPEKVLAPTRFPGQFALGANERKTASDWPGSSQQTPLGWGKLWQSAQPMRWSVHFPEAGDYSFALRAYGDGPAVSLRLRVEGQTVPDTEWTLTGAWQSYEGSLSIATPGLHTVEILNTSSAANNNVNVAHLDITGAAPAAFTLAAPVHNAVLAGTSATLDWTQNIAGRTFAPSGAETYTVEIADDPGFTAPIVRATVTGTVYEAAELEPSKLYYWRVTARNANGSTTSSTFQFTSGAGSE